MSLTEDVKPQVMTSSVKLEAEAAEEQADRLIVDYFKMDKQVREAFKEAMHSLSRELSAALAMYLQTRPKLKNEKHSPGMTKALHILESLRKRWDGHVLRRSDVKMAIQQMCSVDPRTAASLRSLTAAPVRGAS